MARSTCPSGEPRLRIIEMVTQNQRWFLRNPSGFGGAASPRWPKDGPLGESARPDCGVRFWHAFALVIIRASTYLNCAICTAAPSQPEVWFASPWPGQQGAAFAPVQRGKLQSSLPCQGWRGFGHRSGINAARWPRGGARLRSHQVGRWGRSGPVSHDLRHVPLLQ